MKYNIVRNGKDLPKVHKTSRRYRVMMKRWAAKYHANANGGYYGKR